MLKNRHDYLGKNKMLNIPELKHVKQILLRLETWGLFLHNQVFTARLLDTVVCLNC